MTVATVDRPFTLAKADARKLVDQINDSVTDVWFMVIQAYAGRAWVSLGYDSWDALCKGPLRGVRMKMSPEDRQDVVERLRSRGLSQRAIGSALGVDVSTVSRALAGVANATPAPAERPSSGGAFAPLAPTAPPAPVTGTDGKTYTQKPPAAKPEPTQEPLKADLRGPVTDVTEPKPKGKRQQAPVLEGDALALDAAEQTCEDFGSALGSIEGLMVHEHRARVIEAWKTGALGATPHNRELHTPTMIRELAYALIRYATDLEEQANA